MDLSCKPSVRCTDSHMPVRATYVNLYKWPESDAEFVRSTVMINRGRQVRRATTTATTNRLININSPAVVDSYSCRQLYLRSYTFSRKESIKEKARRYLVMVKKKVGSVFPCFRRKRVRRRLEKKSNSR